MCPCPSTPPAATLRINFGKAEGRDPVRCRRQRLQRWSRLLPSQEHKDASPLDVCGDAPKVGALGQGGQVNKLFYGDNLDVLRGFADASVDLIYLDPPSFVDAASINRTKREKTNKEDILL